ncbi:MAG TPA: UTP--glucose-1-phosphate uridylyltransferase GalU, partial [Dehalococcoidia bacterium]|nr:UTP--glucose-1-phosphate uridylyltransferase GalU [Dehalococcoidia bacterium]
KEMLPLVDKPIIQYTIEEAVASGIEQIIIVTALGKHAIENHFDRTFELEYALRQKGDEKSLLEVQRISELANISYIRQKEQLGLGHAVLITEEIVGDDPFAVFLPDDIIEADVPAMKQMLDVYDRYNSNVIAVESVEPENTAAYGIITPKQVEERVYEVLGLVEKPEPREAPSNLGVVGRYILTPDIFSALKKTAPGKGGEIQLTDGMRLLLKQQKIYAYQLQGKRHDVGTPLGLLKASVELALHNPDFGPQFSDYLRQLELPDK